jgi:hypothetical protein
MFAAALACLTSPTALRAESIFAVSDFADPPWSLTYFSGFSGALGTTATWPAEMGWQGDRIDISFELPATFAAPPLDYRFEMTINARFTQLFAVAILAGPSEDELVQVHYEQVSSPRTLSALIPLSRLRPGRTNLIRIQGVGAAVGEGQPSGIQWNAWSLATTDGPVDFDAIRLDQLDRLTDYIIAAIQPSGLVRDSLTLAPGSTPFHPATPDAAGFALLGLCAADHLGIDPFAQDRVRGILAAYSGNAPNVNPDRSADGHWYHWLNIVTGDRAAGWVDGYTTIGSALLVAGAQFARNHFIDDPLIAQYADELTTTTNFNAAIHPSQDGRVYLLMAENGGGQPGELRPFNEFMLVVSLALRETSNQRALAVSNLWLSPATMPKRSYASIPTLTDNPNAFASAFWVHQMHFFNADFASNRELEGYFYNHRVADQLYCATSLAQAYRYGLTAGVDPTGYFADRINDHHFVYAPEAVAAWGDMATLLDFRADQIPTSNGRYRYGMVRVSSQQPTWIPNDAGLVDHLFLMYGLVESIDPLFFVQRQFGQPDEDADGIATAYDNCPARYNPGQLDTNSDGIGDACDCPDPIVDADEDGFVDLRDVVAFQRCVGAAFDDACVCFDANNDGEVTALDYTTLFACAAGSGPDAPADPACDD